MSAYVFDHAWDAERVRLAGLEVGLDPGTILHLEDLGVGPGWRCWEIGAGKGSIAAWLCERVGNGGQVLATDLETTFVEELPYANVVVRRQDILADDLPEGQFDLVHARWVLHWLPARKQVLARMIAALRPHGWLLVEEPDFVTLLHGCASETVRKVVTAGIRATEAKCGSQSEYGRHLLADVCGQGLTDVEAVGRVVMMRGGSPLCTHLRLSIAKVAASLIGSGGATPEGGEGELARMDRPGFATMSGITLAAGGRGAPHVEGMREK